VNLSTRLLQSDDLVAWVLGALEREDVPADALELEITESVCMANPEQALAAIGELAQAGVQFTVDDFGTGYSSLAYLKRLPVRRLKVDKSFVIDMLDAGSDASIVRSIVELGHNLGLRVIAEGVEDPASLHLVRAAGCDLAQGYHFSRPVPPSELEFEAAG